MIQARCRVLIVDDQLNWRSAFTAILAQDYDIETVGSYLEAEKLMSEDSYDVVILDIRLKDEDVFDATGISLARRIRASQPQTRIVIVTGYSESIDSGTVEQVVDAYIEKAPEEGKFRVSEFKTLIRMLVDETKD